MSKVKEITVQSGRTVGLPGYSSIKASAHLTITVGEEDSLDKVFERAWEVVDLQVSTKLGDYIDEGPGKEWLREETPVEKEVKISAEKRTRKALKPIKD